MTYAEYAVRCIAAFMDAPDEPGDAEIKQRFREAMDALRDGGWVESLGMDYPP